jgi:hypothetical protein
VDREVGVFVSPPFRITGSEIWTVTNESNRNKKRAEKDDVKREGEQCGLRKRPKKREKSSENPPNEGVIGSKSARGG